MDDQKRYYTRAYGDVSRDRYPEATHQIGKHKQVQTGKSLKGTNTKWTRFRRVRNLGEPQIGCALYGSAGRTGAVTDKHAEA